MKWDRNVDREFEAALKEMGIDYPDARVMYHHADDSIFIAFQISAKIDPRDAYATLRRLKESFESCTLIKGIKADRDRYQGMVYGLRDAVKLIGEAK